MEASFLSSPQQALSHFEVTEQSGLSQKQVHQSLEKFGKNGDYKLEENVKLVSMLISVFA